MEELVTGTDGRRSTLPPEAIATAQMTRLRRGITIDKDDGWTEQAKDAGEVILISRTSGSANKTKMTW